MPQILRPALAGLAAAALAWGTVTVPVGASGGSGTTTAADPVFPGEVILRLSSAADLASVAADYRLAGQPLDQLTTAPLYLMQIADGAAPEVRAAALATDNRVAYAEPNVIGATPKDEASSWAAGGNASEYVGQWAPNVIHLTQAQAVTRGAGLTVAVLDTGVDSTHPALLGHLVPGYDFVDNDADPTEVGAPVINTAFGHGTSVAGLVALVAPEAHVMPVRVLNPDGFSDIWRLAKGMVWAANAGADVMNLSLSTNIHTHLTNELISSLATSGRGIVVVAAAGNYGNNVPQYPAAEGGSRVLAVGASTPLDTLAPFSDYGSWVRVAAPGVSLLSPVPGGGYASWSGTSMAAGLASGEAALVRAVFPSLNAQNVIGRIASTSTRIGGPVQLRINAAAALAR
jgi:subtilisin family serine protease